MEFWNRSPTTNFLFFAPLYFSSSGFENDNSSNFLCLNEYKMQSSLRSFFTVFGINEGLLEWECCSISF